VRARSPTSILLNTLTDTPARRASASWVRPRALPNPRTPCAGPVAVALVGAFRGTLVRGSADRLGELGLDQSLVDGLGCLADTITNI